MIKKTVLLLIILLTLPAVALAIPTTTTPLITPSLPQVSDSLTGYCNSTNTGQVNYNWRWYKNGVLYDSGTTENCYQETSTVANSCGGLNTGSYAQDNNGYLYYNYSKIPYANNNSLWEVKHGSLNTYNVTIPNSCWNADPNTISFRFEARDSAGNFTSEGSCYDGSNWLPITNRETIHSISASATVDQASKAWDGDYSTSTWYYSLLGDWGVCSSGDCGKALMYEEAVNWAEDPHYNSNQLTNLANISSGYTAANDEWILSCQATDLSGQGAWVNSTPVVIDYNHSIPLTEEAILEDAPYMDYEDLKAYCNVSDNNAVINYDYEIYKNGALLTSNSLTGISQNTKTLVYTIPSNQLVAGDSYVVSCRGDDGTNQGSWLNSTTANIRTNHLPTITNVIITPNPIHGYDDATCSWNYNDADGDLENGTTVKWFVNNVLVNTTTYYSGNTYPSLSQNYYSRGDVVKCSVLGKDGYQNAASESVKELNVTNTLPTMSSVTLAQDPSRKGDALTCTINGAYDADGDLLTFYYEFLDSDNTTVLQSYSTSHLFDCGTTPGCTKGDHVLCRAFIDDGYNQSIPKNDSVSIVNTKPEARNVLINPYAPQDSDDLFCNYTYYDVDGDSEGSVVINWYQNGSLTSYHSQTLSNTYTSTNDTWRCEVTTSDGSEQSLPTNSSLVTIDNNDPYVIVLSNDGVVDEGDNITFTWTWYNAGLTGNITHYLCNSSNIDANGCHDTTLCVVNSTASPVSCSYHPPSSWSHDQTAYLLLVDSNGDVSTMASNNWYLNHRPLPGSLSLTVTSDGNYNYYNCSLTGVFDVDGDNTTGLDVYYYYNDQGALLQTGSGVNTYIVSSGYGTHAHPVECRAQASDGRLYSAYLSNDSHPRVTSVVLDSPVEINDEAKFRVSISNTSALASNPTLDYITSLNLLSANNQLIYNSTTGYYELTIHPNSVGLWLLDKVFFEQTDGEQYVFKGDSHDYIEVTNNNNNGGGGGQQQTTIINNTNVITTPYCGDGVCGDNEDPMSCWSDCQVNYDSLFTCLWDDNIQCNWEQNWFIIFLVGFVIFIILMYVLAKENKKVKKPKNKHYVRRRSYRW